MLKTCGNKSNAMINYGVMVHSSAQSKEGPENKLRHVKEEWYCVDHFHNQLKKSCNRGKVRVEYPLEKTIVTEPLDEHLKMRRFDNFYNNEYKVSYNCRFK